MPVRRCNPLLHALLFRSSQEIMLVAAPRTRPKGKANAPPQPGECEFLADVGRLVRLGRAKRGITRRKLAQDSGISERYLAQIEGGQGNPSVIVLKAIAEAIDVAIIELLPRAGMRTAALSGILDLLSRTPLTELPGMADVIERRLRDGAELDRAQRIALVGLRGAGKSTLGRLLAEHLSCPFVELDRVIEQDYGASIPLLIEMSGQHTFRRYERACLERLIAEHDRAVIATAGGIVANPETYALLLSRTHAIWIKAKPNEHMSRVIEQGDFRPMAQNREAMADLIAILDARGADYARAGATLDTSGQTVEESFTLLQATVEQLLRPRNVRDRRPGT
jgi:XRE family aerobic/anaerobic benzoate catabolism transcriptional regulator